MPHCSTPNLGDVPRQNIYFRVRRFREGNPHEGKRYIGHGVSDHPDVAYFNRKPLQFPPSSNYNPFKTHH